MGKISKLGFARQQPVANARLEQTYIDFFINEVLSDGNGFYDYQREIIRKMLLNDGTFTRVQRRKLQ